MLMIRIPDTHKLRIDGTPSTWEFTPPDTTWLHLRTDGGVLAFFQTPLGQVGVSAGEWEAPNGDAIAIIHASLVAQHGMPTYSQMCALKDFVFGPKRHAAQIMPPESEHVNIHSRCLHLWGPLHAEDWPLPRFGEMGTI